MSKNSGLKETKIERALLMQINNRTRIAIALEILERVVPDENIVGIKQLESVVRQLATWHMNYFEDTTIKVVDLPTTQEESQDDKAPTQKSESV